MALTPTQNHALLKEIDEAVRHDDLRNFWMRYGRLLIAGIVIALLALGGWLLWQDHSRKQAALASERYATALVGLASGKPDKAAMADLAKSGPEGYRAGARLLEAGALAEKGDVKAATAAYGAIAADTSLDQPWRDLALVRQTALAYDSLPPQTVIDRLKPLAEAGNPWFGSAGEMTALAWLKLGKPELAAALFAAIAKDPDAPRSIQTRAVQMASLLGVDAEIAPRPGETKDNAANAQ